MITALSLSTGLFGLPAVVRAVRAGDYPAGARPDGSFMPRPWLCQEYLFLFADAGYGFHRHGGGKVFHIVWGGVEKVKQQYESTPVAMTPLPPLPKKPSKHYLTTI